MAIEKFKFVSPGVQINEIDDTILVEQQPKVGPVIIGNTARGPAMQPVMVSSVAELEKIFGQTSNGVVGAVDVWRSGVPTSPTLATYAAKAFLKNSAPVTVVRLAGVAPAEGETGNPGWEAGEEHHIYAVSGSGTDLTASLAGVIYTKTAIDVEGVGADLDGLFNSSGAKILIDGESYDVSFQNSSQNYIRNVLNTNPAKYDSYDYFLGQTFENTLANSSIKGYNKLLIKSFSNPTFKEAIGAGPARTGVVVSELSDSNLSVDLFHFVSLENGSYPARKMKISIENVRASKNTNVTKYGTFDVVVRSLYETTLSNVLERFASVTLDPNSDNYIVKRIGDATRRWDPTNLKYIEDGTYENMSSFIRVVMSESDIPSTALPAGFRKAKITSKTALEVGVDLVLSPDIQILTGSVLNSSKNKRFGLVANQNSNADLVDILRFETDKNFTDGSLVHTDFLATSSVDNTITYVQGTRTNHKALQKGLIAGFDMPMYDGFDAKDITEAEPIVNDKILAVPGGALSNVAFRSIKQALDMVSQPELLDMNILCVPGVQNEDLTQKMLDVCRERGDSIALIDLKGDYLYSYEYDDGKEFKPGNVTEVVNNLNSRAIDNSYGAAYFPAVFVPTEGIFMPASIAALGAIGGTEGRSALWFAPAGFNRGGLSDPFSGIGVSRTALHLTSADRDELYNVNINPIATFPNEGVVIFGQKTLQATPSSLDRVNVRRMVNHVKKFISRAATRVLFEPNVEDTWNSFKAIVDPFLADITSNYGLDDAKVVLDKTTTTQDLVDRNIMYCKVFLKPTRTIEYIAIDLAVTNSGAAFAE